MLQAWHFTTDTLRDGRPIPSAGEWLECVGPLVPGRKGLHGSERLIDALRYAPGLRLHRVELDGEIHAASHIPYGVFCARRRRIVASYDVPLDSVFRLALEAVGFGAWCEHAALPALQDAFGRAQAACDKHDWAGVRSAAQDAERIAQGAWTDSRYISVTAQGAARMAEAAGTVDKSLGWTLWHLASATSSVAWRWGVWRSLEDRARELLTGCSVGRAPSSSLGGCAHA
jgi:hypothetical protein